MKYLFILIAFPCLCYSQKLDSSKEYLVINNKLKPDTIELYKLIKIGIQISAFKQFPNDEMINSVISKTNVEKYDFEIVKGTDGFYHLITSNIKKDKIPKDNIEATKINIDNKVKGRKKSKKQISDLLEIAIYELIPVKFKRNHYMAARSIGFKYRIQLFALDRFLSPDEVRDYEDKLNIEEMIYEFDNEQKKHQYLLPALYESKEEAEKRMSNLKKLDKKLLPMIVRYSLLEHRN